MAAARFLAKLLPIVAEEGLYLVVPIDTDAHPEHPIVIPPIPPTKPPEMTLKWMYVEGEGWYRAIGPSDKPRPLPPEFAEITDGKWKMMDDGYYFVSGPYDKPQPPGQIPPVDPPVQPPPPKYTWEYRDDGWYFTIGPFDKPRPQR